MVCISNNILFSGLIGSIIGGVVSLVICKLTLKHDKKNKLFERFSLICKEFDSFKLPIAQNVAQVGDEVSTGYNHKDLKVSEAERILFLLSEVKKIAGEEKAYLEIFFNLYDKELSDLLYDSKFLKKISLITGNTIYELTKEKHIGNNVYKLARALFLDFSNVKKNN